MVSLEKYYKEYVLTEQAFVKDPDMTISEYAKLLSRRLDDEVKITASYVLLLVKSKSFYFNILSRLTSLTALFYRDSCKLTVSFVKIITTMANGE